ncbi:MAG TPA: YjbQ family protein [Spirochaetes bacterium]|nr:YjbQ family protein [Spirochaetota bacterium]
MIQSFSVQTSTREELVDITSLVQGAVKEAGITEGVCHLYTPHTTAALTINENADPTVRRDIIKGLAAIGIEGVRYAHGEGNSPAHIKSSLVGCSETVFIENGRLKLGTWQGLYFCEFDGPRTRQVWVRMSG